MDYAVEKFFWMATGQQYEEIFNRTTNGQFFRDNDNARQRLSSIQSGIRIFSHGVNVMRKDNTVVRECPIQHCRIVLLKDFCVLYK